VNYDRVQSNTTRLIEAAVHGDTEAVKRFIAAGDNVNAVSTDGNNTTALLYAVQHAPRDGNYELVKLLIAAGADVNVRHNWGYTPLMVAVRHHSPKTVTLLLSHGADVTLKSQKGEDALDWARQERDP